MLWFIATVVGVSLALAGGPAFPAPLDAAVECSPLAAPVPAAQRKFHPGHYVAVGRVEAGNLRFAAATPGISGVQRRYRWAQLEPEQGRYDLTAIAQDLRIASAAGVQLVAMVEDKTFDGTVPTPGYLQDGEHTLRGPRGSVAARWNPLVVDRFTQLIAAIGARFDCDPSFEGIALQETALSLDPGTLRTAGYSAEKYRDSLIRILRGAAAGVPRSRVFWYMNFLPGNQGYLDDIALAVVGTGVVMGGPDILPENSALAQRVYPIYRRFHGRLPLFGSMQHDSYRHPRGAVGPDAAAKSRPDDLWSMEELFVFARDELHVDYVFWEYRTRRSPPHSRDWNEAREVIARHPELRARRAGAGT